VSATAAAATSTVRLEKAGDQLAFLDGLRGLAALWVMLHHARWLLWEGWESFRQHTSDYSLAGKALVFLLAPLRYGHEAVIFFFLLSGFVIHLGYAKRLVAAPEQARFGWLAYLGRRARRLYPPLVLALVLTFLLDWIGLAQGWSIYRGETPYPLINSSIRPDLRAEVAAGNLAFLMRGWFPCYGSNGPLWSLHFEWWFYMIYPLVWLLARRSLGLATAFVAAAFAAGWFVTGGWLLPIAQIFIALLTWWFGALLAEIHVGRWRVRWSWLAPLVLLLPALPILLPRIAVFAPAWTKGWAADTLYGLGFAGLFACCFMLRERGWRLRPLAGLRPLGEMSYTLYVTHMPILVFISGWLLHSRTNLSLPAHFGWFAAGALACLLVAWAAHFLVERPFVRRKSAAS
jgi:peptidoglycan/LPS O-acetylase OafA/YrhL